jgi:hypothetical protein
LFSFRRTCAVRVKASLDKLRTERALSNRRHVEHVKTGIDSSRLYAISIS